MEEKIMRTRENEVPAPLRRRFCLHACQAVSLAAFGSLLDACSGGGMSNSVRSVPALPSATGSVANGSISIPVDSNSPVAAVGSAALVQTSAGSFLVVHSGETNFTALTAICTHQQCTITGFDGQTFVCPCHGSEYNTSGRVLIGPAQAALRQFTTQFANNVVTITL